MISTDANVGRPLVMTDLGRTADSYRRALLTLGFQEHGAFGCLKFTGNYQGRPVTVALGARTRNRYATPGISYRVYSGLILDIHVETTVSTYLMCVDSSSRQGWLVRWLQRMNRNYHVESLDSVLPGYRVFAREPEWAAHLVGYPDVLSDINRLLREPAGAPNGSLIRWGPRGCGFTPAIVPAAVTVANMEAWLQPLVRVASAAEKSPPLQAAELTWLGKQAEAGRMWMLVLAVLLGIPMLLFAGIICLAILLALFL